MIHHAKETTRSGRTSRTVAVVLGVLPLVGLLAACGGGGGGAGDPDQNDLQVLAMTPVNGQETHQDLSDPGLLGKITVHFTSSPNRAQMIDANNAFNNLTPNVQILDQAFRRVPGTPSVDPLTNTFTFIPYGGTLPHAQYTVTISKYVTSAFGKSLNNGLEDFSASFVARDDLTGAGDEFPPVIRNTSPANNQNDVPIFTPVVITFNESIDIASIVPGTTVFAMDAGVNPPAAVNGTWALKRKGFDLVFIPDVCAGMPPATNIVIRLAGVGNTTFVKDIVGNGLIGDPTNNNEVQFQFQTKGVKRLPNQAFVPLAGSPRVGLATEAAYVSTADRTYAFDVRAVNYEFAVNLRVDMGLMQMVLEHERMPVYSAGPPPTWYYGSEYGGDWAAKVGQAGESIIDWRFDPVTLHTYIYQCDEANDSIAIINSGTGKVEGHFTGVGSPKGITISASTGVSAIIYVSNYGQGTVTGIPVGGLTAGKSICTAVQELNDDPTKRLYMTAGRGPSGIACEYLGVAVAAVVNKVDGELQIFDPNTLKPIDNQGGLGVLTQRYQVGENPFDVAWAPPTNVGVFAYIVSEGGPEHPDGSVTLWWSLGGLNGFAANAGQVSAAIEEGVKIPGHCFSDPTTLSAYVPNSASDDVVRYDITTSGSAYARTVTMYPAASRTVGEGPTDFSYVFSAIFNIAVVPLAGTGQVAFYDLASGTEAPYLIDLPGARRCCTSLNQ